MTAGAPRRRGGRIAGLAGLLALALGFAALGSWQVERRAWKLALIARVEQRVQAGPVPAPTAAAGFDLARDEYRRVTVRGRYLDDRAALVQAVTEHGAGWWVLTPLQRDDDPTPLLVNRGFVPSEARGRVAPGGGPVRVTGLMRADEPGGGFLRRNDPAADRWHSRDVGAIGSARGLAAVAPWFLDAQAGREAAPSPIGQGQASSAAAVAPLPGLTVVAFHNSHAVYAITWYTLALMAAYAAWRLRRETQRDDDPDDSTG